MLIAGDTQIELKKILTTIIRHSTRFSIGKFVTGYEQKNGRRQSRQRPISFMLYPGA